ncbi:hypothetical protein KR044_000933 [Drosophila immigrans]|nr:hypothetical protein KR044_000933 [Drosophila immigrans]
MHKSSFKSEVIENPNPSMLCSREISGAKIAAAEPIGDWSITPARESDDGEQTRVSSRPIKPIVIVEPRLHRGTATSIPTSIPTSSSTANSSSSSSPDWFMLPHSVDANNDVMRLVSSLSTVVQILTRMTNAAAQELRQHPEREEGFQGLRLLLNYADQMYTTLLQPQTFAMARPGSQRNAPAAQTHSLFHHLFEPIRNAVDRGGMSPSPLAERPPAHRAFPYRVAGGLDPDAEQNGNGL